MKAGTRSNVFSPSQTQPTGFGTLPPPAQGGVQPRAKRGTTWLPARADWRKSLWIEVQRIPGSEPRYRVTCRTVSKDFVGDLALHDLVAFFNGPLRVTKT